MPDFILTQEEADELMQMEGKIPILLIPREQCNNFLLGIKVVNIPLKKVHYQNSDRTIIILTRFNSGSKPPNPYGFIIEGSHLHLKEGYGDKWAYPLLNSILSNIEELKDKGISALNNYGIKSIPWSKRDKFDNLLAS